MRSGLLRFLRAAASASIVALAACATAPDLRVDQDPSVDLGSFKTFAFFEPVAASGARYTSTLDQRLQHATREQLERHGYVYRDLDPDLLVNVRLNVADRIDLRSAPRAYGYGGWAGASNRETVHYRQGTLAIDLVDAKRHALVWQGVAEGRLGDKAAEDPQRAVDSAVGAIFARFDRGS